MQDVSRRWKVVVWMSEHDECHQSTDTQDRGKSLVWMLRYGGGQSTDTWDRGKSLT
jgi:hypothetical protein